MDFAPPFGRLEHSYRRGSHWRRREGVNREDVPSVEHHTRDASRILKSYGVARYKVTALDKNDVAIIADRPQALAVSRVQMDVDAGAHRQDSQETEAEGFRQRTLMSLPIH